MSKVDLSAIKKEVLEISDESLALLQGQVARVEALHKVVEHGRLSMDEEGRRVFGQLLEKYHEELGKIFSVAQFGVKAKVKK